MERVERGSKEKGELNIGREERRERFREREIGIDTMHSY